MKKINLISLIALIALVVAGCGGGTGPVKVDVPDFYPPALSVISQSPEKAAINSDLVLTVSAKDNSGTPDVKMYYRRINSSDFTELLPGTASTGNNLVFTIPKEKIDTPGVEYYFTATDGTNSIVNPSGAPVNLYKVPLKYINIGGHTEINEVRTNSEVTIQAEIVSDGTVEVGTTAAVKTGFKYWQDGNQAATEKDIIFDPVPSTNFYKGTIGANILSGGIWHYYIFAETSYSDGTTVKKVYPDNASTTANYLTIKPTTGYNNKPVITPRILNESDKLYVNDVVKLYVDITDDGPADQNFTYNWSNASGTSLELSEYDVRNPQTKSGIPGTFTYDVVVTDADGQKSDTASITLKIETPVLSGEIPSDVTTLVLSAAASPYTVVSDFTVPVGKTLKIERGVKLKFKNETSLIIKGTLQADGDAENPITFTADTTLPYSGYWTGIYLGDENGATIQSLAQSTISYCVIEYSKDGLVIKNAESPTISNCTIQKNENQGIYCEDTTLTINKCNILENGNYGVYCKRSKAGATPLTYATISSNTIKKNLIAGVYCEEARIDLSKNDITENKYGVMIVKCKNSDSEVVNIVSNRLTENADGIRVEDSNVVISGNKIFSNKNDGIVGYTTSTSITAGFFTTLDIRGNAIHNNNDDGIQLENCYSDQTLTYALYRQYLATTPHITNNIISYSGGEGIECIGSSPIVSRNHIARSADNGILCKESEAGRFSSPFITNTNFLENARAAIAVVNDRIHGGKCAPVAWWCNFYANNKTMIDLQVNPGFDLVSFMDFGGVPAWLANVDPDDAGPRPAVDLVTDTRYGTGGRSYYKYSGGTLATHSNATGNSVAATDPNGNSRFGWNISKPPLFESAAWEDPFSGNWLIKSDSTMPRNGTAGDNSWISAQDSSPTSELINSGEPIHDIQNTTPLDLNITNALYQDQTTLSTSPPYSIKGDTGTMRYVNYNSNSNLTIYNFVFFNWPTL